MKKDTKVALIWGAGVVASIGLTVGLVAGLTPKIEYITYTLDSDIKLEKNPDYDVEIVTNKNLPGKTIAHKNKSNKNFNVMAFTDLHLDHNKDTCSYTFSMVARNIIKAKPDLVVFCGDNITSSYNEPRSIQFAEMLEKLGVYWCAVLGNHEKNKTNPNCIERDHMLNIFCRYSHCLIDTSIKKTEEGTTVWGKGNTLINLACDDGVIQSLYFLDSGTEMTADQMDEYCSEILDYKLMKKCSESEIEFYDHIKNSQVNWYQETFSKIRAQMKKEEKKLPHSTIFTHVPIIEQEEGYLKLFYELGDETKAKHKTKPQSYGGNGNLRAFTDFTQTNDKCKDVNELYSVDTKNGFVKGERNRRREDLCYSPHDLRYKEIEKTEGGKIIYKFNTPIFKAMKVFGDNNAFFAGHDHSNNYTIKWDGQFLGYINSGCYSSNNLYTKGLLGEDPYKVDTGTYGGHLTQGYTDLVYKQSVGTEYNVINSVTVKENYEVWEKDKPDLYKRALDLVKNQLLTGKKKVYVDSHANYLDGNEL